jgi:hypothetical protein
MSKKKHTQTVLAEHFGMDVRDLIDYRYHYGLTPIPMYHVDDHLYAVSRTMPKYSFWAKWEVVAEVGDGRKIWREVK